MMNYFARENTNLARIDYKNSYKIDNEIERLKEQSRSNYFYNEDHEYAVVWYGRDFKTRTNADDAIVYVDVELVNLTRPTYILKEKEYDAYITIEVAINYLHKLPIGSIWKNGRSKQRFDLPVYRGIAVTANNYKICSIAKATNYEQRRQENNLEPNEPEVFLPFAYHDYYERIRDFDKNQLIIINPNNQRYVIHPILLFITHYGYSMDIKRIISRYPRNTIREKLAPFDAQLNRLARQQGYNDYVIIPRGMTQRDAVFLQHYKFDNEARTKVNRLADAIYEAKDDKTKNVRVDFWHLPTTLNLRGIRIGDAIFCTGITAISEPVGETINLLLQPRRTANLNDENEADFTRVVPFTPPQDIEDLELDFVRDPVNNISVQILKERLERIGELREINRVQLEQQAFQAGIQFVPHPVANQAGIGDLRGKAGETALAKCFYEVDEVPSNNRFNKIWQYAKECANELGVPVHWFTYEQKLQKNQKYCVMSLKNFHNPAQGIELPENVLVIILTIGGLNYYMLEFGEVIQDGKLVKFKGVAYREDRGEDFLYSRIGLIDLLLSIVDRNGVLSYDFADKYEGKLGLFLHRNSEGGNWVKNAIRRVINN